MNAVEVFSKENWKIRTVVIEGQVWFVAKDVAQALGYQNESKAIADHTRGVTNRYPIQDSLNRTQEARIIQEPDVYRLIMGSKLPSAQKFEKWVMEEVLPTIRKAGAYTLPQNRSLPQNFSEALRMLANEVDENDRLRPKAEIADTIADASGLLSVKEVAKEIGVGEKFFWDWLIQNKVLYKDRGHNLPYQEWVDSGYLRVRESAFKHGDKSNLHPRPMFTGRGLTWIVNRWKNRFTLESAS